jgi:hypothetical protein
MAFDAQGRRFDGCVMPCEMRRNVGAWQVTHVAGINTKYTNLFGALNKRNRVGYCARGLSARVPGNDHAPTDMVAVERLREDQQGAAGSKQHFLLQTGWPDGSFIRIVSIYDREISVARMEPKPIGNKSFFDLPVASRFVTGPPRSFTERSLRALDTLL